MARKKYQGEFKDKDRSMQKLLDAVGTIIRTQGYTRLSALNISRTAGLSRRLIDFYFGNTQKLIEKYVRTQDYYVVASDAAKQLLERAEKVGSRELLLSLLHNQLDHFFQNEEMQKIILWQISEKTQIMFEVAETRERFGDLFFEIADKEIGNSNVDLRAVAGLLVAGIYYMVLHAKANDSLFCQIDVNSEEGLTRIKNAISAILVDTYRRAEGARI